jgi:SulP family sulfate permease
VLTRLFPFLRWFPLRADTLRADAIAGVSVALVLVPQSMAYAQLAGMPAYYGLYAAFLPVIVAALWGSSNQLATGPAAVSSILTASALAPLAALGSEQFVAYAIMLAFMVGVIQLGLGVSRLGSVVSFLSHPVILGFTSAAAIVIALSQLNKLLGLPIGRSAFFLADIWEMLGQIRDVHAPSVAIGLGSMAIIWGFRRWLPRWPGVLVAVVVATTLSWATGFERRASAPLAAIEAPEIRALAAGYQQTTQRLEQLEASISALQREAAQLSRDGAAAQRLAALRYEADLRRIERDSLRRENRERLRDLRRLPLSGAADAQGRVERLLVAADPQAAGAADRWRIRGVSDGELALAAGGEVVGYIPPGLPALHAPEFSWEAVRALLSAALIIALVGFVEAISIAKAIAAKTRQRIDANQELIGQGLSNLAGSFSQAFPTMGSFSRSAVNYSVGARSGLASVLTGLLIGATLLFLTPAIYHLPQSALAAIIIMAVLGLIGFGAMRRAWRAQRDDGIAAWVTFSATLLLAPALDYGVLLGAGLAVLLFLYRTMQPRVALLDARADGTLQAASAGADPAIVAIRFDGQLYFANVPHFEDAMLEAIAERPSARGVLIIGDGINRIDASGVDALELVLQRLRGNGLHVVFCGLKPQVLEVLERTGLRHQIGDDALHPDQASALAALARMVATER